MLYRFIILILLVGFSGNVTGDNLRERPIENRNLYLPFLLFLEPYATTPLTINKGKISVDSGIAISNMIDDNNAFIDGTSGYPKYKPLYWRNYSNLYFQGQITPTTYYLSELLTYGRLEQQSHLKVDSEIERFHNKISYGLFKNFEIGLEVTLLSYNTGVFDKPITGYHRAIGIPYPLRDIYPDNKFHFELTDNTKYLIKGKPGTGTGDSVLDMKWLFKLQTGFIPALAWINSFKIPTGNKSLFMGSGRADIATGISAKWNFYNFYSFLNLFGIIPSDPFNSREIHIKPFGTASTTLGYSFTDNFSLLAQLEIKGSPYHSNIKLLNKSAVILSFGFNWKIFSTCALRVNIMEDPITRTIPDVSAQSSLLCMVD